MTNEASRVLARIDREVWIITSQSEDGRRGGLLASWVQQVSLDEKRLALLVGIHPAHFTRELIDASGRFMAHLVRENQIALALHFASGSGRDYDKLAAVGTEKTPSGGVRLRDCAAFVECRVFSRLATGDRIFYWADCVDGGIESTAEVLREAAFFRSLAENSLAALRENRRLDVEAVRVASGAWREELPDILRFSPTK